MTNHANSPEGEKVNYIVLCGQIVGSGPYRFEYWTDYARFTFIKDAIKHGFDLRGSDDFNIGVIEEGRLVRIDWMDTNIVEQDPDELALMHAQLGLDEPAGATP
jgi:hypothetical protein